MTPLEGKNALNKRIFSSYIITQAISAVMCYVLFRFLKRDGLLLSRKIMNIDLIGVRMQKLNSNTYPVGTLLSQQSFFRIPEYQRPFSWDAENFEDLIVDLIEAKKDQEYFLGTVVVHEREDEGYKDVIDGQQRITSLLILLACLRDLVENVDFKKSLQDKILQPKNLADGIPERIRLEVKDRTFFNDAVVSQDKTTEYSNDKEARPEPEWRYVKAIKTFREKLEPLNQEELQNLIQFISQRCVVIYLSTSEFEDAFRLFTIVNDRGKQLRRIDILKAINIAPDIIVKDTVRNKVAQDWEELEKELGERIFESVFHLTRFILLKDKPQVDLLKEFENRIFAKNIVQKGEAFFDLMFKYVEIYASVFIDRDIFSPEDTEYNRFRALIHIMNSEFDASEWRACVLQYVKKYGKVSLYPFLLAVEKIYLQQWVKGVRRDQRYEDYAKILQLIEVEKNPNELLKKIKFDLAAIQEATQRPDMYNCSYAKYFLLRLELVTMEHDAYHEFDAKSIEHVLPQKPDVASEWLKTHDAASLDQYVNSIGNLVLLSKGKNSSARNFEFEVKKEKYLKSRMSDYPRSLQVLKEAKWDRAKILERTQSACELITQDP